MASEKAKAAKAAANTAKAEKLKNPLTGKPPNSFTKVTNQPLDAAHPLVRDATAIPPEDTKRMRKAHVEATSPNSSNNGQLGYRRPEGMDPAGYTWLMGGHRMFPNTSAEQGTSAINEPHAANTGVTVMRRAEDLSGPEYRKGEATLRNYGYGRRDPVGELADVQGQAIDRTMGEHAQAGVEESSSQKFYGHSPIQTRIPDPELQKAHETGVMAANNRFNEGVGNIEHHDAFKSATTGLSDAEKHRGATNVMASATSDTSPNARWRTSNGWPNMEQAEESANAGLAGRTPRNITGYPVNQQKAADRTRDLVADSSPSGSTPGQFDISQYGNQVSGAKTIPFRGNLVDPNASETFKASDVHQGHDIIPGVDVAKSKAYRDPESGKRVMHYSDQPDSHVKGMAQEFDGVDKKGNAKPVMGASRVEDMLAQSSSTVHSLNDYATRRAASARGLSRGANFADNVAALQAAPWGAEQARRPDLNESHASQYPVVRDWGSEGHADLTDMGKRFMSGDTARVTPTEPPPSHMDEQWRINSNTIGKDRTGKNRNDVSGKKPYPIMPYE